MSVASLRDVLHVVDIADEIESFFNVIIYNAVRYMPHTLKHFTTAFIDEYFHGYKRLPNGHLTVGTGKVLAITVLGCLPIGNDQDNLCLTFGESADNQNIALNSLIRALLKRFKARYAVLNYENKVKTSRIGGQSPSTDEAENPQLLPRPTKRPRVEHTKLDDDYDVETPNIFDPVRPTDAKYKMAARLKHHDDVRALLRRALDQWTWPLSELKSDHLTNAVVVESPLDGISQDISTHIGSHVVSPLIARQIHCTTESQRH